VGTREKFSVDVFRLLTLMVEDDAVYDVAEAVTVMVPVGTEPSVYLPEASVDVDLPEATMVAPEIAALVDALMTVPVILPVGPAQAGRTAGTVTRAVSASSLAAKAAARGDRNRIRTT
jgi:hypothetical protein